MKKFLKQFGVGTMIALTVCAGKVAMAGERGGNGGDAVVCFPKTAKGIESKRKFEKLIKQNVEAVVENTQYQYLLDQVVSVQTLDYWEALKEGNFSQSSVAILRNEDFEGSDPKEFLVSYLQKLGHLSSLGSDLHRILYSGSKVAFKKWSLVDGLIEINDSSEQYFLPSSCLMVQAASNKNPFVFLNEHLYAKMDPVNRFTLLLHELVYMNEYKSDGTSIETRALVRKLLSRDLFEMSSSELFVFLGEGSKYGSTIHQRGRLPALGELIFERRGEDWYPIDSIDLATIFSLFGVQSTFRAKVRLINERSEPGTGHTYRIDTTEGSVFLSVNKGVVTLSAYDEIRGSMKVGNLNFENVAPSFTIQDGSIVHISSSALLINHTSFPLQNLRLTEESWSAQYTGEIFYELVDGRLSHRGENIDKLKAELDRINAVVCRPSFFTRIDDSLMGDGMERVSLDKKEEKCMKKKETDRKLTLEKYRGKVTLPFTNILFSKDGVILTI